ncbi:hypothetical protein [Photobacterium kishitanii]|uniref:Uncharacterized protein n=1 Tax=Photobacterium kishitanii TaxID=318456 RepID=A0A2T3KL36_9GAMM|nr:hypothetical protein [Photobacterium kishitanii]PSV00369.1 hypothetical protein C9J27_04375 [Photobacterium kishitanii]
MSSSIKYLKKRLAELKKSNPCEQTFGGNTFATKRVVLADDEYFEIVFNSMDMSAESINSVTLVKTGFSGDERALNDDEINEFLNLGYF